jgi:hypothetical protein
MTDLRSARERYLNMRQGLGYKYQHQARRLADFVSFMETHETATINHEAGDGMGNLATRSTGFLGVGVDAPARFARHVANIDPQTEVAAGPDVAAPEACEAIHLQRCGG